MDRRQLESTAAGNRYLRGLLVVPVGVLLIASALGNMEWGPFRGFWPVPACMAAAAAAYALLLRYYNENYGRARPKMSFRGVAGMVAAIVVMAGGSLLVQALDVPLNGIVLSWAVVALAYYATTVGLRAHHIVIWGTVLVVGLVPLWGDARTTDTSNVGMLIVGAAVVLTGVLDHRLLSRTLGRSVDPDLQTSNATR